MAKWSQILGFSLFFLLVTIFSVYESARAQMYEVDEYGNAVSVPKNSRKKAAPKTGRRAAAKYMNRKAASGGSSGSHYMAVHFSRFFDHTAYKWGEQSKTEDAGRYGIGVTYRIGEWTSSMDLSLRAQLTSYKIDGEKPYKLSLMPVITFPEADAKFPLYFGGGLGLGAFLKQISGESSLSIDYTVLAGARFFNLFNGVGALFEIGLDNHIHLLSDGQTSGVYASVGSVFEF